MKKSELIELLAAQAEVSKAAATRMLETLTQTVVTSVKKGENFSIAGFGTFKQAQRAARKGRNPATGEAIKIGAVKTARFTPAAAFKAAVDPRAAARKAAKKAEAAPTQKTAVKVPAKKVAAKKGRK